MMQQSLLGEAPPRYPCIFSEDRRYRYLLRNVIDSTNDSVVLWVLANPSVADEVKLDNTLRKCENYSRSWGFGEMRVVNVRAWISTDPDQVPADPLAIGPLNTDRIIFEAARADLVVCGWGALAGERGARVLSMLHDIGAKPHALQLNASGTPTHPLYLRADLKPFPMEAKHGTSL